MTGTLAAEGAWERERLDRDYSARDTVSSDVFDAEMLRYRSLSDAMREPFATHLDIVYDGPSGQKLDIFGSSSELRPAFIAIHGGYWRMLSKRESTFMAGTLAAHGIATVAIDYGLAPKVSLTEIVREARAAVAFIWHCGRRFGIDPERIYVGGSSAGGHLAGTVISAGWHQDFGVPEDVARGALLISGLFHLAPIANCFAQDWLALDGDAVRALSPAENLPVVGCPITLAYADGDADGFQRQSAEYHRLWVDRGFSSELIKIQDRNHFDVIFDLCADNSLLTRALLRLIQERTSR